MLRAITGVLFLLSSLWTGWVLLFEEPTGIDAGETMVKVAFYGVPMAISGFLGLVLGLLVILDPEARRQVQGWRTRRRARANG